MSHYNVDENLLKQLNELGNEQAWNHSFENFGIPNTTGKQTSHGKNEVKWNRLKDIFLALDVSSKNILDLGCNEGFFSHQLAQMGAKVQGVDIDKLRIKKANFINSIIKTPDIHFNCADIYSPEFSELPHFDICLCLGFLHRIPDPFRALESISKKTNIIVFEWKTLKFGPHHQPFAYYSPGDFEKKDYYGTQFWLLSFACVEEMLKRLGYNNFYRIDDPKHNRAILVAGNIQHPIFEKKNKIKSLSKIRIFVRHTKFYLKTLKAIFRGELNA